MQSSTGRLPVAVLGATGTVGQRMLALLEDHPRFELVELFASARHAGRPYAEVARWMLPSELPAEAARLPVRDAAQLPSAPLVFSALSASVAGELESACARAGKLVVTNAKSHRFSPGVPLVVPEVNPEHLALLEPGSGGIVANPNCTTIGLALALAPLHARFGVRRVSLVSMQALSGAGLPGVPVLDASDNVLPWIDGEEEKIERETARILGTLEGGAFVDASLALSAQCNRVPVLDGHMLSVSVSLERAASRDELLAAWEEFRGEPQELGLPSAPAQPIRVHSAIDAPQPRLQRELDGGMSVHVGRVKECALEQWRFVALVHNTLRGAAGGSLLLAEQCQARGLTP